MGKPVTWWMNAPLRSFAGQRPAGSTPACGLRRDGVDRDGRALAQPILGRHAHRQPGAITGADAPRFRCSHHAGRFGAARIGLALPMAARTEAALISRRVPPSISIWPQIWLTISSFLTPQPQYARSTVTLSGADQDQLSGRLEPPADAESPQDDDPLRIDVPSLYASARPSPASATRADASTDGPAGAELDRDDR